MATLRKANAYSKRKVTPYTRKSKRRKRAYIKVVPPQKIVKFDMGKIREFQDGKFPRVLRVISLENVQLRHNAMEAARQYLNKKINKETAGNFYFKVVPFPHHIQRENKMITGAGADRMQTGMQLSFGKSIGRAAILKTGDEIFIIGIPTLKAEVVAREAIKEVRSKLPGKIRVLTDNPKP